MRKTIICDGDSWVFGSEIIDPKITKIVDHSPENDYYRLPRIFSTHLGKLLNSNVINISCPADDNGTILHRIMTYISSNYISKSISTENMFVIIGWTSIERNFMWYKENNNVSKFMLYPYINGAYPMSDNQKRIWKDIVEYLWNAEEYLPRYVMDVINFQNFCNSNNIKWLCFNSFYGKTDSDNKFTPLNVIEELSKIKTMNNVILTSSKIENIDNDYISLWNTIDKKRFYKKDKPDGSFRSFIENYGHESVYNGIHPSPESHELWANELYNYIINNNLF